jgi:hypothetical protein
MVKKMDYTNNLIELMIELLGSETLLNELLQALGTDQVEENLEYIARQYDISTEDL